MSESNTTISDRLLDLLVEEAACGLNRGTSELGNSVPDDIQRVREALMEAASVAQLGFLKLDEAAYHEMPDHLRQRILASADNFFEDPGSDDG